MRIGIISRRGQTPALGFSDAIATGLAPDGGLLLLEKLPDFSGELARFEKCGSYAELCFEFLRVFATDIPADTLRSLVNASYTKFSDPAIAPLKPLAKNLYVLELFHGPTLAFKDFALQLLGNLYAHQCATRKETINVLGAISGDTGAAAIHGLIGRPGTAIFILYPDGRVSPLQERQMTCTGADNVFALAVDGTFDDAQASLKEIFRDQEFRTRHRLSAVNSINLARVLAQCVYYLHAWLKLPKSDRGHVGFIVPSCHLIKRVHRDCGYIADPHTACGFKDAGGTSLPDRVQIVLSTASPAKFPDTIKSAIGIEPTHPSLEALKAKPIVKHRIKATPDAIRAFIAPCAVH